MWNVEFSNINLSFILNKYKKFKPYIRKKTYKFNTLKFWVKNCIFFLYAFDFCVFSWQIEKIYEMWQYYLSQ